MQMKTIISKAKKFFNWYCNQCAADHPEWKLGIYLPNM